MSDVTEKAPDPATRGADRTRAHRIRARVKRGDAVEPIEAAWLSDYEQSQAGSMGASASRRVSYTEEEHAAIGTGSAAEVAAAAALAREEGRRFDYLLTAGIDALMKACGMYKEMATIILARNQQMEDVHLGMLGSVREHYIKRVEAEADAIRLEAEKQNEDPTNMMLGLLAQRMLPQMAPQPPTPTATHRNGRGAKRR